MKPSPTILIVDDVPQNISLLLDALTQAGYRVLVAESAESALQQLPHRVPDLVLLDLRLPGIDGIEACGRIHAIPSCRETPVIIITALHDVAEKVRALDAGAVDYVTKPLEPAEVLARVRTHLRIASLQRELREEIALREEAEELLREGLQRALVVVDPQGGLQFATRLARTVLNQSFPGSGRGHLPPPLLALLAHPDGSFDVNGLRVRLYSAGDRQGSRMIEFTPVAGRRPADFLALGLTPREAEVLFWVCEGKSNPEIAIILGAAPRTIDKHVENILRKVDAPTRAAAVSTALDRLAR